MRCLISTGKNIPVPKPIIWSHLAENDLANILEYLNAEWGDKVAFQFVELTENTIRQISLHPRQFPYIFRKREIRKCVLTKHNTIYYRAAKTQIHILRIYDTRQDPENLQL